MNKEQIMGLVRHIATFLGGILVAKGLATSDMTNELVGSFLSLVGVAWSILSKKK